jgi:hypothetical protein
MIQEGAELVKLEGYLSWRKGEVLEGLRKKLERARKRVQTLSTLK